MNADYRKSSRTTTTAYLIHQEGGLLLKTDYVEGFLDDLREQMPRWSFKWNKKIGCWVVATQYLDRILTILEEEFDYVIESWTEPVIEVKQPAGSSDIWSKLHLRPGAPKEVVNAAYKALSKIYHPDSGGSHKRMCDLNAAYDELKK